MSDTRVTVPPATASLDRQAAWRTATNAMRYAHQHRGALRSAFRDVMGLGRMVVAWATREYDAIPWKTAALAIGALVYFINPLDLVADVLPVIGFADDLAVLGLVIASMRNDLERFRRWEAERGVEVFGGASSASPAGGGAGPARTKSPAGGMASRRAALQDPA